ncbi:MAG: thermonuclease family protein [Boseongicola sp.]|nr:thermonuclease family protein [Boseongicola sp.]MDD9976168.1 thermonuclease family protein [Boseongicola sp.]
MRRPKVVPLDQTRRRRPKWSLGAPPAGGRRSGFGIFNPRFYLKWLFIVGVLFFVTPIAADGVNLGIGAKDADGCRVARVVDGDTVTIWCPIMRLERVRVVGYDTPEKFSPLCATELVKAVAAEWHLRWMLATNEKLSIGWQTFDRYDRRLAVLELNGVDVARLMVRTGYARSYDGGSREGWCG